MEIREMEEARFQPHTRPVRTHTRDSNADLRQEVPSLLQAVESVQIRPDEPAAGREVQLCPRAVVDPEADGDDAEDVTGYRTHVAGEVPLGRVIEPRRDSDGDRRNRERGALRRPLAGDGYFERRTRRDLEANTAGEGCTLRRRPGRCRLCVQR